MFSGDLSGFCPKKAHVWFSQGGLLYYTDTQPNSDTGSPGSSCSFLFIPFVHSRLPWDFWHELAYLTFWEVGAEAKTEIFFFSWNNGFKCKIRGQGRRQEGRRLQPLRPSHFLIQESQHFPWSIASYKTLLFLVWTWIYRRLEFRCLFLSHFSLTPFFFPSIK